MAAAVPEHVKTERSKMSSREKFWLTAALLLFAVAHAYGASMLAGVARAGDATPVLLAHLGD
jgi:hypothetical protein